MKDGASAWSSVLSKADRALFIINKTLCVWPGKSTKLAAGGV